MAATRALLSNGLPALLRPSLLYAVGVLIVAVIWTNCAAGRGAAAAATLVVTCPLFILLASVANVDVADMFFILLAFSLIHRAMGAETPSATRLVLAGACLGLAMLSRETSTFAVAAIGLLFLAGYGMRRGDFFLIGGGFVAVVGLETLYLRWLSGDMLYRDKIALNHDATINRWLPQGAGVPLIHPLIDPIAMLLLNHNFGLLTWIGVPLTAWLIRRGTLNAGAKRFAILTIVLAATWALIAAAWSTELNLMPRYFMLPAVLVSMLAGVALARLWQRGRYRLAAMLGVVLVVANVLCIWIDNHNYMYGEHELSAIAARVTEPIRTDPTTLRRSDLLLQWQGSANHVTDSPPSHGDLFYFNPAWPDAPKPGADWTVVERHGLPPTIGQIVARALLPTHMQSPSLMRELGRGAPDVRLHRLPQRRTLCQ
ncbi:MAG TPA: glycosyltransferase family 39 protein [Acetobacteraceae bacterium]|nr:glycosyltransferase family 39 protein [Acetobacteraceae bacterium]